MEKFELFNNSVLFFQTPKNESYFFGYYNYTPLSADGTKLLAHKAEFEGRMPNSDDTVEIGFFDTSTNVWNSLAKSKAFNWQQGSMTQWMGPDFSTRIIFNDVEDGAYVSRIVDVSSGRVTTIPKAIYGVSQNGDFSISLNFERCFYTRAYSYASLEISSWNQRIPEKDGILYIDLSTGESTTMISLPNFLQTIGVEDDGETSHWFEHIMLNPDSTRFSFYYRHGKDGGFTTRCFVMDIETKEIWEHPLKEGDTFSHLGWRNPNEYVLYSYPTTALGKVYGEQAAAAKKRFFIKPLLFIYRTFVKPLLPKRTIAAARGKDYYGLTIVGTGVIKKLSTGLMMYDGHPSFTADQEYMLTDTYQDDNNVRHLYLHHLKSDKQVLLGSFNSVYNNCGWRADLHPRFSPDESSVIIDSNHSGNHQELVINLDWNFIRKKVGE